MSQYRLDESKALELKISNDAFFYLLNEDEPLDEINLKEAQEILNMFPCGFIIKDDWKSIENSGLITAVFIPYVLNDINSFEADFDEVFELTKYIQIRIKWLDDTNIRAWWHNLETNTQNLLGDFEVYTDKGGKKYFHTAKGPFISGKSSMFFLKSFKKKDN